MFRFLVGKKDLWVSSGRICKEVVRRLGNVEVAGIPRAVDI